MTTLPTTNGANGRDHRGRFMRGNAGGPGNPHCGRIGALRSELLEAVKPSDLRAVIGKLIRAAKAGEPWAVRELLDRTLGRPVNSIEQAEADRRTEAPLPARIVIQTTCEHCQDRIFGGKTPELLDT